MVENKIISTFPNGVNVKYIGDCLFPNERHFSSKTIHHQ